jgi:DNA ligase (NAD+)
MILAPTNCPSCDYLLKLVNDQLYCYGPNCSAQVLKQIEHFSKTLKIKGLGPATIEKLGLNSISDIYAITLSYATAALSSEKMAIKLLEEIEKSKSETLNTLLPAFGIPLVGGSVTDKLAAIVSNISEINETSCKEAGLGPKATTNLLTWLDEEFFEFEHLPFSFEFTKAKPKTSTEVYCITGKLVSYKTKAEAKSILEKLGHTVKDSLTKDVTILVNESGVETAKTQKARDSGVIVITNLKTHIGEN